LKKIEECFYSIKNGEFPYSAHWKILDKTRSVETVQNRVV